MKKLYQIIINEIKALEKKPTNLDNVIKTYWLTDMACKIVYINNHYHIGNKKQIQYFVRIYNTVINSKVVNLENIVANDKEYREKNSTSNSFINSSSFDVLTINTIRDTLRAYIQLSGTNIKITNIPKITLSNGMKI